MNTALRCLTAMLILTASGCAHQASAEGSRQVIIGFADDADPSAPATLARLRAASAQPVVFVSAISPRSAAYRLACSTADPDCAEVINALRALPGVRYVQPDTLKETR